MEVGEEGDVFVGRSYVFVNMTLSLREERNDRPGGVSITR